MFRPVIVLLAVPALAVPVAGCGADDEPKRSPHVRLSVDGPSDGAVVRDDVVSVHGTVRPRRAVVEVAGRRAEVVDGSFSVDVPVGTGANVLDVAASAADAVPAVAGVRVVRDERVTVPDLVGLGLDEAESRLRDLDLEARFREGGGFLDDVLPTARSVCATEPDAGSRVAPGTTVTIVAARLC